MWLSFFSWYSYTEIYLKGVETFSIEQNLLFRKGWYFGFRICLVRIHASNGRSGIHMGSLRGYFYSRMEWNMLCKPCIPTISGKIWDTNSLIALITLLKNILCLSRNLLPDFLRIFFFVAIHCVYIHVYSYICIYSVFANTP